jgi:hypothetical protein
MLSDMAHSELTKDHQASKILKKPTLISKELIFVLACLLVSTVFL